MLIRHLALPVTLVVIMTSCGERVAQTPSHASADVAATAEATLSELGEAINGTLSDREAAKSLVHVRFQSQIQSCMAASGFDYTPALLVPSGVDTALPAPLPGAEDVLVEISDDERWPADFRLGTTVQRSVEQLAEFGLTPGEESPNPGYEKLDSLEQEIYNKQVDHCVPPVETYDVGTPPVSATLSADLAVTVAEALRGDARLEKAVSAYGSCMATRGIKEAHGRIELADSLAQRYSAVVLEFGLHSSEWVALRELETKAAKADAVCRGDAHRIAMELLSPILLQWRSTRADEIRQSRLAWGALSAQASQEWADFVSS